MMWIHGDDYFSALGPTAVKILNVRSVLTMMTWIAPNATSQDTLKDPNVSVHLASAVLQRTRTVIPSLVGVV